jgi:CxxC-x17-CxxC domain-containing protein
MGNFQKGGGRGGFRSGNRGGDRGSQGDFKKKSWGNDRGGDRDRGSLTMHRAICTECGKNCELPFRPIAGRPVLCKECFGGKKDNRREGGFDFKERSDRRDFNDKPSFSFSKPVQNTDDLKKQISELNTKVDRLIALVEKSMKAKGDASISKGDPVIVISKEKTKTPSLKTIIEEAVVEKAPAKAKKVITKKKK